MRLPGLACLLLAIACACACGDIETVSGGGGDSGPAGDAGSPDARAIGSVSVTLARVFGSGQPLAGNQVVVVDTAGDIVADLTTDDDGSATAEGVEAGSTLIILIAAPPTGAPVGSQALVIAGVEPGDDIHIDPDSNSGPAAGDMNVSWPPRAGTNLYQLNDGCSQTDTNDTITAFSFEERCLVDDEARILIRATDAEDATLGWVGGTIAFAAGGNFDVAGPWTDPRVVEVDLSDIPSEAESLRPRLQPARGPFQFNRVFLPPVDLTAPTVSVDFPTPKVFADSNLATFELSPNQPGLGINSISLRLAAGETAVDLAVADELLPWLGAPVLDTPSHTFSWTRSSGREADAQFLGMFFSEKGDASQRVTLILLPPDVTSLTLPELPAEYERYMPDNAAQVAIQLQAGEASDLDGYRAARQTGFSLFYNSPPLGLEPPATLRRSSGGADF